MWFCRVIQQAIVFKLTQFRSNFMIKMMMRIWGLRFQGCWCKLSTPYISMIYTFTALPTVRFRCSSITNVLMSHTKPWPKPHFSHLSGLLILVHCSFCYIFFLQTNILIFEMFVISIYALTYNRLNGLLSS